MNRLAAASAAALLLGCGSLPTVTGDVAILEVTPPPSLTVDVDQTLQFSARTLDKNGHEVEAPVSWHTPDTTITIGASTGLVTGITAGTGRVQAMVGEDRDHQLVSEFVTVTVRASTTSAAPR